MTVIIAWMIASGTPDYGANEKPVRDAQWVTVVGLRAEPFRWLWRENLTLFGLVLATGGFGFREPDAEIWREGGEQRPQTPARYRAKDFLKPENFGNRKFNPRLQPGDRVVFMTPPRFNF